MFRVVGKVQGSNMKERWYSGYFLGKRAGSEENLVMTSTGSVVRARAIREMHRPLLLADLDVITGTPHDPIGTIRAGHRDEARGGELAEEVPEDAEAGSNPKRVQITKEAVNKFGGTPGCLKCRGVVSGDRTYQFVHHSPECRTRMEDLMRRDDQFARKVEAAEERQKKRIAEVLEKKDQEAAKRAEAARRDAARVPPEVVPPEVPPHDAQGDPGPQDPHGGPGVSSKRDSYGGGASSSGLEETERGNKKRRTEEEEDPEIEQEGGDPDMGVPLATEETADPSRKREAAEADETEPRSRRPRLEKLEGLNDSGYEFDVCEIFSPPRVCSLAGKLNLIGGYSIDKVHVDAFTNQSWDLTKPRDQSQLWGLLRRRPARMLILSPPCTTFSCLQRLRKTEMDPKIKKEGIDLLKVAVKAAHLQLKSGGLFIFEHPRDASSWQEKCLTELAAKPGVQTLILDQCMYGLTSQDREGVAPARKCTRILTNVCGAESS